MCFQKVKTASNAAQGNTILEYCLIGGLITMVCVGGFMMIGTNWNSYMLGVKQDMLGHKQAALSAQAKKSQVASAAQAQIQAQQQAAANGQAAAASASSAASNSTVETVGANGHTGTYAQNILDQAKQALASGKLTQTEYDIVAKLANKGHDIASIQGLLENAFKQSNGNSSAYANTQLTFNGQNYTPAQLNAVLESNISDFGALRSQASVQNGVLYDQALLTSINDNGGKIINNGYSSQQQNQTADSFIQYQNGGLGADTGSSNTHQESAIICTNGQHVDANNHCVP